MYKVYWTETFEDHEETNSHPFDHTQLMQALACCEELRAQRRAGRALTFITLSSEDVNSVGQQGVSDKLPVGYDWTKQDRAGKTRRR